MKMCSKTGNTEEVALARVGIHIAAERMDIQQGHAKGDEFDS